MPLMRINENPDYVPSAPLYVTWRWVQGGETGVCGPLTSASAAFAMRFALMLAEGDEGDWAMSCVVDRDGVVVDGYVRTELGLRMAVTPWCVLDLAGSDPDRYSTLLDYIRATRCLDPAEAWPDERSA